MQIGWWLRVPYFVGFQTKQICDLQTMLYHPAKVPSLGLTLSLDSSRPYCVPVSVYCVLRLTLTLVEVSSKAAESTRSLVEADNWGVVGDVSMMIIEEFLCNLIATAIYQNPFLFFPNLFSLHLNYILRSLHMLDLQR